MIKIGIIVGSTRPGRRARTVAEWIATVAAQEQSAVDFEIIDLADFDLPLLDEDLPAMSGRYGHAHTVRWSEAIDRFDGFVFVTPEYNRSLPGALKNALDFLYAEWNNKAAGIVGYGMHGGIRAAEHLRGVLSELKVATVRSQVALSLREDFTIPVPTEPGQATPGPHQAAALTALLDELVAWSKALRPVREGVPA